MEGMIPAGYMRKRVMARPAWLKAATVADIHSVSRCMSSDFADFIGYWKHNGYWLFDRPQAMAELAKETGMDLSGTTVFYYEVFAREFDVANKKWAAFRPDESLETRVDVPRDKVLEGFDVVSFSQHNRPECSPLSCCALAERVAVNEHCLFRSFAEAKKALEEGLFDDSEPGPFRIFAVYSLAAGRDDPGGGA